VSLVEGDINSLPFAGGSVDMAPTVHVYHLVPDRMRLAAERPPVCVPHPDASMVIAWRGRIH